MKKSSIRFLSLLLAIIMIAGMLEAPIGLLAVNAVDTSSSNPLKVYYNNDFAENADGITYSTYQHNHSKHDATGGYLYLRAHSYNDAVAFWNKGADGKAVLELPEQFVVSFDVSAIDTYATWELHLVDENGNYIRVLSGGKSGSDNVVNYLYSDGTSNKAGANYPKVLSANNNKFNTVTLAFDMTANKYSYTFNNNNGGVAEKPDLTLRGSGEGGAGEFGTVQYIAIEARGDDSTTATPANLIIDNLKVYEGTEVVENVGAQNQFPPKPKVYYNNDFATNADGITFSSWNKNYSKHDATGGYLYLRAHSYNDAVAFWNKGADGKAVLELPEKFVVSFDFAAIDTYAEWELHLVDENGNYIRVLSGKQSGSDITVNYLYSDGTSNKAGANFPKVTTDGNIKNHTVTLVFDMTAGKYSYTFNNNNGGVAEKPDLLLRGSGEGGTGEFGTVQYIAIEARGDDSTTATPANLLIDNMKVYSGAKVVDAVGPQDQFPPLPTVYYNNDFATNADGITYSTYQHNHSGHDATGGYLYLRAHSYDDPVAFWNKGENGKAVQELPEKFVVSFDFTAIDAYATWELHLVDENGNYIRVLSGGKSGGDNVVNYLYSDGTANKAGANFPGVTTNGNIKNHTVTLIFDMTAKKYSYTYDNNNGGVAEKPDLLLRGSGEGGAGEFGTVQYIAFEARGDNSTTATPANLIIDNLKVYEGNKVQQFPAQPGPGEPATTAPSEPATTAPSEPATTAPSEPATTAPSEPESTVPVKIYYNNDFSTNANGITFDSWKKNYSKHDAAGGYLYLRAHSWNDAVAYWNKGEDGKAVQQLSDKFVVSFDLATIESFATWEMHLVDENGNYIRVLSGKQSGSDNGVNYLYSGGAGTNFIRVTKDANIKYHSFTLIFDMTAKKYSYTFNNNNGGIAEKPDLALRGSGEGGSGEFGTLQYIAFESRGDDVSVGTPANIIIDNLRIYEGNKVQQFPSQPGPGEPPSEPATTPSEPSTTTPTEPESTGPVKVYYNNDFNKNADGINIVALGGGSINYSKHDAKNGYIYLRSHQYNDAVMTWNTAKNGLAPMKLPSKFVVTFDLAYISQISVWEFHLVDESGNYIRLLSGKSDGVNNTVNFLYEGGNKCHYPKVSADAANINRNTITLVIDMDAGKYYYKFDNNQGGVAELPNLTLRGSGESGWGDFGTIQHIAIESRGDDGTGDTPANLIIDNLKIYSGNKVLDEVGKQDQFQQPPEFIKPDADPGNYRYCDYDFSESIDSMDDLVFQGGAEIKKDKKGNYYVDMVYMSRWSFNYYRKWDLTDYIVSEFTVSTKLLSSLQISIHDTTDVSFVPIYLSRAGSTTPEHDATLKKLKNGEWVKMAVAVNTVDKTYSVWFDGVIVLANAKIPKAEFGKMGRIVFSIPTGDLATAEGRVDNLRVYQGFTPDDYKNTVLLKEPPMDESYLDEWMGEKSPLLNYATQELKVIKSAGAVMVNTDTLYIYKDGKRTQGTKAQVDAILKNTSGKKVIKNGLGLVIIGPKSLALSDEQIAALHDYMIYVRPTAKKLKSLFKSTDSEHPRVILTPDRVTQLRSAYKNNATIKALGDRVIRSADLLLKTAHIKFSDPSFTTLMNNRYQTLSMAYLLTKDAKYKDYLWKDIQGTGKFANWRTHEYLATATAAFGVSIAYDWLYDAWTPAQRKFIEESLYKHVLYHQHKMVYHQVSGTGVYVASDTNRNAVCNGGVGMACIALFDVYPDKVADIMEKTYHLLEIGMDDFAPSGATTEGPAYWDYLMQYLVPFLQTSFNAFGTDFNLLDAPGMDTTVDYILDIDGMTGVNNFHDSAGDGHLVSGEIFGLATMMKRPDLARALLAKMDIYRSDDGMDTMLYMDTSIKYDGTVDKPLDGYYDGMEVFSMRSSWTNSAGIFVSAHSGKTGISHDHLDSGTFVLDFGGQRFASDIGKEDYNIGAVNELAYYYYRKRPEGHNVFVINPDKTGNDLGMNIGASDVVSKFVSKERGAYAIMPLDSAYAGYAKSATRGIMLGDDRKSVLIRDEIRGMTKDSNEVWWFMQMENVEVEISKDGKSATLSKGGVNVHVQVATNAKDYEIKVLPAKEMYPLKDLPGVDKQTPNTNYTRLAIVFKTGKDVNINVKFAEAGNPKGDTPIKDVALSKWSIPSGVLKADPVLDGIEIGGVRIPDFTRAQTFYNFELPYGTTECPDVRAIGGEGCTVEIKKPKYLPDYLTVTVTSNADSSNQTKYRIYLTVSGPISVQVSATPEPANHGKNMLDGNLGTRWAIDSAGWAKFTFPSPQMVDAIWLASWYQNERVQPFNIEVSEDGVNFKQVWNGKTEMLEEGEKDRLQEFKIPAGMYKSIRLNVTSAEYPDGRSNPWTSILEVMFYYKGKPIEIILQTSDPDEEFNENPNENIEGPDNGDNDDNNDVNNPDGPSDQDESLPSDVVDGPGDSTDTIANKPGMIWLIVGLSAAAVLVAGAIVLIIVLKKKKAAAEEAGEQPETPVDSATE